MQLIRYRIKLIDNNIILYIRIKRQLFKNK